MCQVYGKLFGGVSAPNGAERPNGGLFLLSRVLYDRLIGRSGFGEADTLAFGTVQTTGGVPLRY